jgi:capsular polysaccharide biosynthesis protein
MDINDSSDPSEPGSAPDSPFLHPDWAQGAVPGQRADRSARTARRTIMQAVASHWTSILLLWVAVAVPVAYLIYSFIEPTYEAVSLLRAEPAATDLFGPALRVTRDPSETAAYLETQIQLIKSDSVLDAALANPAIGRLPMIRSSKDFKAELRRNLEVAILGDNTSLIRVSLDARDPAEAAMIVNAVVDSYMEQHTRFHQRTNRSLKRNLENERDKLEAEIRGTRERLASLARQHDGPIQVLERANAKDGAIGPSFGAVTEQQFTAMTDRLIRADFELMDAQARLEAATMHNNKPSADKLRELESSVEEAKRKKLSYTGYISQIKITSQSQTSSTLEGSLLNQDFQHLKRLQDMIKSKLAQIDFEISQEAYRISVQDKAAVPKMPSNNRRLVSMAVSAVGVLFLIIGLYFVREVQARYVTAPNAAS